MDLDSVRRRHPTPASPIVSRRPAAMPVTPRATPTGPRQMRFVPAAAPQEAGIAKHVSVDSEDEDDWGHFSFEDGDAPPSSLENYRWN